MSYLHSAAHRSRKIEQRARDETLLHYGGDPPSCACCGETTREFLAIDHIGGGGAAHRRSLGGYGAKLARWLRKNGFPPGYRILCHNCNHAHGLLGYCPHERDSAWRKKELTFIARSPGAQMPTRGYEGDAGWDLYASEDATIGPGQFLDIPSGVSVALPPGVWAEITGRSSTLRSKGLMVSTGVIDNGWRGSLFAGVFNLSPQPVAVRRGERLAQLIPHPIVDWEWSEVDELPPSERGVNGFGSTGA